MRRRRLLKRGGTMLKQSDVEAALANCRALINQINAGLSGCRPRLPKTRT
jgi:hypothetical protein